MNAAHLATLLAAAERMREYETGIRPLEINHGSAPQALYLAMDSACRTLEGMPVTISTVVAPIPQHTGNA